MNCNKISCIIVDDERNSREVLKKLLNSFSESIEVIGEVSGSEEAYSLINKCSPQLIFLDIQMPGEDGFSLLRKFEVIDFEIIFVTSYDQYAINAIRFNASDYLLKPIDTTDLKNAVSNVVEKIRNSQRNNPKIAIHAGDKVKLIYENEISFIEANGRYSYIYLTDNKKYITPKYLKDFEDHFGNTSKLLRISKSLLVNTTEIVEYIKGDPFIIKLNTGKTFEVSRRKKADVLERLK